MTTFKPTDDQINFEIYPLMQSIREELQELQNSTDCPGSYIEGMLENISYNFQAAK
jgi:hypothetical protein